MSDPIMPVASTLPVVPSIQTKEEALHHFVTWGTTSLHELYILGEAIKNDTTFAEVDKDNKLSEWEKDIIKLLIVIRPLFDYIINAFPGLKSLIDWASAIYNEFFSQGKIA